MNVSDRKLLMDFSIIIGKAIKLLLKLPVLHVSNGVLTILDVQAGKGPGPALL